PTAPCRSVSTPASRRSRCIPTCATCGRRTRREDRSSMTPTSSTDASRSATARGSGRNLTTERWARVGARLVSGASVLIGAATVAFLAQAALPGDRATTILNIRAGQAQLRTAAELADINDQYGL